MTDKLTERVARALANAVGARNGAPYIVNPLALMKPEMRERFEDDARAAIAATGVRELLEAAKEIAGQFPNRRTITETMKDDLIAAIAFAEIPDSKGGK